MALSADEIAGSSDPLPNGNVEFRDNFTYRNLSITVGSATDCPPIGQGPRASLDAEHYAGTRILARARAYASTHGA